MPLDCARHDACAFGASGLAQVLTDHPTMADLGYIGVEGIAKSRTSDSPAPISTSARSRSTPR